MGKAIAEKLVDEESRNIKGKCCPMSSFFLIMMIHMTPINTHQYKTLKKKKKQQH